MLKATKITSNKVQREHMKNKLKKTIKPINEDTFGGEYSRDLLPNLQKFATAKQLDDDLVQLRSGNKVVNSKDLTTTDILVAEKTIEYWGRTVSLEQFIPKNADPEKVLIYFHGGSFYGGQIQDVHNMLKLIAEKSQVQVVNVDYHLAPESPYPNAIFDGVAVSLYFQKQLGLKKIILSGDSAGGNIGLAVNKLLGKLGYKTSIANVLLYPVVTLSDDETKALWDYDEFPIKKEQILIRNNYGKPFHQLNAVMRKYYLQNDEDPSHSLISPLHDDVKNDPNTLLIVGEFDFLRLQDEQYALGLQAHQTQVNFIQYNGMAHAFAPMVGVLPQADDAANEIAKFVKNIY